MMTRHDIQPPAPTGATRSSRGVLAACAIAPLLIIGLVATYHAAPDIYLRHVLESKSRETQLVEVITFGSALLGGVLLAWSAWRLWRRRRTANVGLGAMLIGVVALAAIFFAGEEVSWGQTWMGWETPEEYKSVSVETNLHNVEYEISIPLPFTGRSLTIRPSVQSLGSLFIICVFVVLPLLWGMGWRRLPPALAPAIAELPVLVCTLFAFAWKTYKNLYKAINPDYEDSTYYWQFVEQLNEHKEMLVAVSLLLYGIGRVRRLRRIRLAASD
ncbi:MAG: hypothetical protein ACYTGG_07695 [Planctomycetota bacterium]|jgi:hypothetical protein